jgi:hypothetical protein
MALPTISGCLGAFSLRPSWGRNASGGSARLFAAMQNIWVSLHYSSMTNIFLWLNRWSFRQLKKISSCDAPFKILLGILRYRTSSIWGLFEVGMPTKASSRSTLPDSLQPCWEIWVSLHFVRSRPWLSFSSVFLASNQPCCLLWCSGTTLQERLRRPLVFFIVSTYWETYFSTRYYLTYFFFSFFFGSSYRPFTHHDARILLYECVLDALW